MRDCLVEAADSQVAPQLVEGDDVVYLSRIGPIPATTVLVNDDTWWAREGVQGFRIDPLVPCRSWLMSSCLP